MLRCLTASFVLTFLLLLAGDSNAADQPAEPAALFDGRSLAHWECFSEDPKTRLNDVWTIDDGVLVCKGKPLGYLVTKEAYKNFTLTLQWRWPPGKQPGNGGVLVRMTGKNKIWPKSLEAQLNSGAAGDFWGLDGYRLEGPEKRSKTLEHPRFGKLTQVKKTHNAEKPAGQWNRYEIVVRGDTVTLTINGQQVNKATGCDVVAGKILLTAEGDEIHFRDIHIEKLGE